MAFLVSERSNSSETKSSLIGPALPPTTLAILSSKPSSVESLLSVFLLRNILGRLIVFNPTKR